MTEAHFLPVQAVPVQAVPVQAAAVQTVSLEAFQRRMAAAVLRPLTDEDSMQPQTADGRSMAEEAAAFVRPNDRLSAFERLEIYNRQYWYRVLGALEEDFPGVAAVVGPRRFQALAVAYLTQHPSRSFSLRNLGSRLIAWLADNPQFAGRRIALALDVARIEWAFIEAFDNAELPPLSLARIAGLGAESRLGLQPHLRLLALGYPADDFVLALHQREKTVSIESAKRPEASSGGGNGAAPLASMRRQPTWLAVHRSDFSVYYKRLDREEFLTLDALRSGATLAQALEAGFARSRVAAHRQPGLVQGWFANWAELGWLCEPPKDSDSPHNPATQSIEDPQGASS